jgi:hypothetical protein
MVDGTKETRMPSLKASVQYGDFHGTVAADRADDKAVYDWLVDKGRLNSEVDPETETLG